MAASWKAELDSLNIDKVAQQEVFCLSQEGHIGRGLALGIMGKLLKHKSGDRQGAEIRNPSAWLHGTVKKAWESIDWGMSGSWQDFPANRGGSSSDGDRSSKRRRH